MARTVVHSVKGTVTIPELTNVSVVAGVITTATISIPVNQIIVSGGNRSVQDEFGTYRLVSN